MATGAGTADEEGQLGNGIATRGPGSGSALDAQGTGRSNMTAAVAEDHSTARGGLETELKSMIVANLHRLGRARRASDDRVSLRPLNARRFFIVRPACGIRRQRKSRAATGQVRSG